MKPYRVEYVQLSGWEEDVIGLWVAENDDWLLLRAIPVDYVVDGYVIIAKHHIRGRKPKRGRKQVEQVLKLKGVEAEVPVDYVFADTVGLLRWVEQRYGLVEFTDKEDCAFFGWIGEADIIHFKFDMLNPNGTVTSISQKQKLVSIFEIRLISFNSDYFNSIKLLWQHKSRSNFPKAGDN